jgi:mannose-1-phosphate guanylyltransferase/phosphomannomutase
MLFYSRYRRINVLETDLMHDYPRKTSLFRFSLISKLKKLFLPINSPRVIEKIARNYDAEVVYTPTSFQVSMQKNYQQMKGREDFSFLYPYHDAFFGLGLILEKIAREDSSLTKLVEKLPDFHLNKAELPCRWKEKGRVVRSLAEKAEDDSDLIDGVRFNHENGWALVIPDSEKPVFHIFAEGDNMESAESLTGFYLEEIKKTIKSEK